MIDCKNFIFEQF